MHVLSMLLIVVCAACASPTPQHRDSPTPPHQQLPWYVSSGYCGFGSVIAAAGDVDRDGSPDFAIADPGFAAEGIVPMLWILSAKDGKVIRTIALSPFGPAHFRLVRIEGGHDIDGDGVPDLLISSAAPIDSKAPSIVQLISGESGNLLRTFSANTTRMDRGEWARFVRDVDGDGADDVAILAMNDDAAHRMLIVCSSRSGAELLRIAIERTCGDGPCGLLEVQGTDEARSDYIVLLEGDEKHAAFAQLLSHESKKALWEVEAPRKIWGSYGVLAALRGEHRVALGFDDCVDVMDAGSGERVRRLESTGKTDSEMGFGWSIAALGDIDADGVGDLVIAETEDVLFIGAIHATSGRTGDTLWTTRPDWDDDVHHLGYQIAAIGDVDGDSIGDLVVGSCESMAGAAGCAFIFSGKTGTILREFRRRGDSVVVVPAAPTPK
jgi:hypothetical protein